MPCLYIISTHILRCLLVVPLEEEDEEQEGVETDNETEGKSLGRRGSKQSDRKGR